jgi:2-C-methyl-D-erythritol 2,4-cyclodiphosphate synthase
MSLADLSQLTRLRIGQGYDTHRLDTGLPLKLGGVCIVDSELGCVAHSDGDVVLHALIDAMISASGMPGDIGSYFPPEDNQWRDANSLDLLDVLMTKMPAMQWLQVDVTIFLEAPKLKNYKADIVQVIQQKLNVAQVAVKAKTGEGMDAVGNRQAISASVLVLGYCLSP